MGISKFVRDFLRNHYIEAWSYKAPAFGDPSFERPNKVFPNGAPKGGAEFSDFMRFYRGKPKDIENLNQLVFWIVRQARVVLEARNGVDHLVVQADKVANMMKALVCYEKRYKNRPKLDEAGAPYLPTDGTEKLPEDWMMFAANSKLLKRELYPRLYNAFLNPRMISPGPGQTLILDGFPGLVRNLPVYDTAPWEKSYVGRTDFRKVVCPWDANLLPLSEEIERADPDLYNRVFVIKGHAPSAQYPQGLLTVEEWEEARNSIGEADLRLFFYDHWFQNTDQIIAANDGDLIPIALLYAHERRNGNTWRNGQWLKLKKPGGDKHEMVADINTRYEYVNVNVLYDSIMADEHLKAAGVQNPVATMVMLMILGETDFVKNHFFNIGKEKVLWKVFWQKLPMFSHMVQLSTSTTPSTRIPRTIVLDEELFFRFAGYCYTQKYGESARKLAKFNKNKNWKMDKSQPKFIDPDDEQLKQMWPKVLKERTRKKATGKPQENEKYHYPEKTEVRKWCRWIEWNFLYWLNGMRHPDSAYDPDVFEVYRGFPYYGFMRDPKSGAAIPAPCVSAKRKQIDQVFKVHLLKHREKRKNKRRRERAMMVQNKDLLS